MSGSLRVHEIAKVLGRSSQEVMRQLQEMGEFARSASSTVQGAVVQNVLRYFAAQPDTATPPPATVVANRPMVPSSPFLPFSSSSRAPRPRRDWYRGAEPGLLTTLILEEVVIRERAPFSMKPGGSSRFFADEVAKAQSLGVKWGDALFAGLTPKGVVAWMTFGVDAESAIALHRCGMTTSMYSAWHEIMYQPTSEQTVVLHKAGVRPDELKQHPADRGGPSLALRLTRQHKSLDQVVEEVMRRRTENLGQRAS